MEIILSVLILLTLLFLTACLSIDRFRGSANTHLMAEWKASRESYLESLKPIKKKAPNRSKQ